MSGGHLLRGFSRYSGFYSSLRRARNWHNRARTLCSGIVEINFRDVDKRSKTEGLSPPIKDINRVVTSLPIAFRLWETAVNGEEFNNLTAVGFVGAGELSFFEHQQELANKEEGFDIAVLLQRS
jgi:hypothetical protein